MVISAKDALDKSKYAKKRIEEEEKEKKIARINIYKKIFETRIEDAIEKGETSFLRAFFFEEIDFIEQNKILDDFLRLGYNISIETCSAQHKQYYFAWHNEHYFTNPQKEFPKN